MYQLEGCLALEKNRNKTSDVAIKTRVASVISNSLKFPLPCSDKLYKLKILHFVVHQQHPVYDIASHGGERHTLADDHPISQFHPSEGIPHPTLCDISIVQAQHILGICVRYQTYVQSPVTEQSLITYKSIILFRLWQLFRFTWPNILSLFTGTDNRTFTPPSNYRK